MIAFISVTSTDELNLFTPIKNDQYLTKFLKLCKYITMHKALLERFHVNDNTMGTYP